MQQGQNGSSTSAQPPSHQNHDRYISTNSILNNNNNSSHNTTINNNNNNNYNVRQQKLINQPLSSSSSYSTTKFGSNTFNSTNTPRMSRQQKLTISSTTGSRNVSNMVVERNVQFRLYREGPVPLAGGDVTKTWIYPKSEKYAEREYQLLISQSAILQNTLVSLPTGLGKTLIAAVGKNVNLYYVQEIILHLSSFLTRLWTIIFLVMYNFYRWFPTGKVIFLAPTRPLVTQQIEACYNIMGIPEAHTAEMSGSTKQFERAKLWKSRRVFFCTPQTLQKDLDEGRCDPKKIVCVVFDEAHKATGKYAYVSVVEKLSSENAKFRVVSLSCFVYDKL